MTYRSVPIQLTPKAARFVIHACHKMAEQCADMKDPQGEMDAGYYDSIAASVLKQLAASGGRE